MTKASDWHCHISKAGNFIHLTTRILAAFLIVTSSTALSAEEANGGEWTFIAGAGGKTETDFRESEYYPIPIVIINYETEHREYFLSVLDGIGFSSELPAVPLEIGVSADFGENRDSYRANGESEPAVKNPVDISAGLSTPFLSGEVFADVDYFPGQKKYEGGRESYVHPLTFSTGWGFEKEMIPLIFSLEASVTFMDQSFADTYYSAEKTENYHAKAGMESIGLSAEIYLFLSEHIGIGFIGEGNYYPDRVAASPFRNSNFSAEAALGAFYLF